MTCYDGFDSLFSISKDAVFLLFKANKRVRDLKLAFKSEDRAEVVLKFWKQIKVDQDFHIGTTTSRFR